MKNKREMPDYYVRTYKHWYKWFSRIYDYFIEATCFVFYGFDGERKFRESIVDRLNPQRGERILDICSGTGTLTIMIARRLAGKGEVTGIEISPDQLRIAREKEKPDRLSFIEGDAQDMPFPDSYFDKSVISGALHEMPREVRRNVLSEAYRVIRLGGEIVIIEQSKPERKWKSLLLDFLEMFNPEFTTYKDMLRCGLTNEIKQAGFRVIETDTACWEFFQIVLAEKDK
jgi:ubiquinone/menaquinone biosynthesis C-methylase UbiE